MKITRSDFISIRGNPSLFDEFHIWEVLIPMGERGKLRFRQERFEPDNYDTPEALYEALMDLLRGCRMSDTEYYVFCDNKLVTDL